VSAPRESPIHVQAADLAKRVGEGASAVLVEDGDAERHTLTAFLQHMGFAVTAVNSGLAYYQELAGRAFTIAVIDLGLPDQAGEILVDYTRQNTASGIVVVTAQDRVEVRIDAFQAGADLFFSKPVDLRELTAAIGNLVLRRREIPDTVVAPPRSAEGAPVWTLLAMERALRTPKGAVLELTAMEFKLLSLLMAQGGTVTRARLLGELYESENSSAARALETLIHRTRQRIATETRLRPPILTHHGVGYIFAGPIAHR
jgi:DNA-binding response OmpR family regulator